MYVLQDKDALERGKLEDVDSAANVSYNCYSYWLLGNLWLEEALEVLLGIALFDGHKVLLCNCMLGKEGERERIL